MPMVHICIIGDSRRAWSGTRLRGADACGASSNWDAVVLSTWLIDMDCPIACMKVGSRHGAFVTLDIEAMRHGYVTGAV